jgi:FkbM family methyltransferase
MNSDFSKKRKEHKIITKIGLFIVSSSDFLASQLNHFFYLKPIQIHRYGKTFFVSSNFHYFLFWKNKSWEKDTYRFLEKYLDKDHSFIDIGAWIGPIVLFAAQIAKKTYAIEPDPIAFKELAKNVSLNPELKQKILLYEKCINASSGKVRFGNRSKGGDSTSGLRFGDSQNAWVVDGITIDDFVKENIVTDCNLIKMDIEGGETIVIPAMKQYLERNRPILHLSMHPLFFRDPRGDTQAIIDVLTKYKHLYIEGKKKVDASELLSEKWLQRRYTVVATDKEMDTSFDR